MSYDIPDKIQYREKIVFGMDLRQLVYAAVFGFLALAAYNLPLQGDLKLVPPFICAAFGLAFVFLNWEEKLADLFGYAKGIWLARKKDRLNDFLLPFESIESSAVIMSNGELRAVLRVYPVNFSLMDDDRKRALVSSYRDFLNHLTYPVQVMVKTVQVDLAKYFEARDAEIGESGKLEKQVYEETKAYELDFVSQNEVKEREYYLVITYARTNDLNEGLARLDERAAIAQEKLLDCGVRSVRLDNGQLWDLLEDCEVPEATKLCPERIDFGDYSQAVIEAVGYPRKVEDGWLQPFLCKNEPYDISIHVKPSSMADALVFLHKQIIRQTSDLVQSMSKGIPNPSLEIKLADTKRLHDALYKGEEKMFRVSVYISNKRKTRGELTTLLEKCKSHLNAMLIIPAHVKYRVLDAAVSVLPLALDKLGAEREFPTTTLSATFPFISNSSGEKKGILFAHEEDMKTPIFLNLNSLANKHFFIIGTSGSGKSYTAKYLTLQAMLSDKPKAYILDPNAEYSELCRSFGGENVELSRESESVINVFDLTGKDFGQKLLDLVSTFDIIAGGLTESQKGVLNEALPMAYERAGILQENKETWANEPPTFTHLYGVLLDLSERYKRGNSKASQDAKRSLEVLINRVRMYRRGGFFGFLDRQTKLNTSSKMMNFDLSKLPNPVKPLMMFTVMDFLATEIKKDLSPKILLIDEGWALLKSKEAENYLLDFVKTSRKYNTSIAFISQEIEDLTRSETGSSILNMASTKLLMRQNASNIEEINRCVRLNQTEKDYLLRARKGSGLLITENQRYKFFTSASPAVHEFMTTNPDERAKIEKSKQEFRTTSTPQQKKNEEWFKKHELVPGLVQEVRFTEEQAKELEGLGYKKIESSLQGRGGNTKFFVKAFGNESREHAFLCRAVAYEAKKLKLEYRFNETVSPDVVVRNGKKELFFEVETGTILDHKKRAEGKFNKVKELYQDNYVILVSNRLLQNKYRRYGRTITRLKIQDTIKSFFARAQQ